MGQDDGYLLDNRQAEAGTDATEGVEVLLHDVGRDDPPPGPFDLVHARLVLVHATDEEIERHLATIVAGRLDLATSPMIAAWGRRPTGDGPQSFL
ncbi:class I SAM-dependent methyltransferase [Streptomyces massasporeus]